ncbi:hypothetical protein [Rhodococcus globerulus]|uniref:AbiTii domain-containing protein n=1 Tax=Rhodococcus globerulus TaxID=33008 RepID=A0ABU4BLI7_RHOGO|nr:hypothetical protein [Rhodococcus globerulus]MDV6265082.1 hypothetical protein [Rhodococcus globerulus]
MVDASRVRTLTERALDNFDNPGTSVAALVRQAQRIAVLRHDYGAQIRFVYELTDLQGNDKRDIPAITKARNGLAALIGAQEAEREEIRQFMRYQRNREITSKTVLVQSIDQIELHLMQIQRVYDDSVVPSNLTPIDTYFFAKDMDAAQAKLLPQLQQGRDILAKVRQSIHEYLIETESELDAGKTESSFFDQVQMRINDALNKYAPVAAQRFIASQERVSTGGSEDISHALTSCRRMMESLADSLYPANNEVIKGGDGIERSMSEGAYKNRILQFVAESVGKHKDGKVLKATIAEISSKLDALLSLANKGVHDDATLAEAHTCVIQTYLLAGSLLAIADGTSYLMQDEDNTASV